MRGEFQRLVPRVNEAIDGRQFVDVLPLNNHPTSTDQAEFVLRPGTRLSIDRLGKHRLFLRCQKVVGLVRSGLVSYDRHFSGEAGE